MKVVIYLAKRVKDKKTNFSDFSSAVFEIPDISIISNREATICGTRGVIEYTQNLIKLNCGHLILTVKGTDLNMIALTIEEVIIRGVIMNIEFSNC